MVRKVIVFVFGDKVEEEEEEEEAPGGGVDRQDT